MKWNDIFCYLEELKSKMNDLAKKQSQFVGSEKSEQGEEIKINIEKFKNAYNESNESSRSIEIHYEEKGCKPVLAKVYFPHNPQVLFNIFMMYIIVNLLKDLLREKMTELVRWNVNRDSMEDKQRELLDLIPALKEDIKHQV